MKSSLSVSLSLSLSKEVVLCICQDVQLMISEQKPAHKNSPNVGIILLFDKHMRYGTWISGGTPYEVVLPIFLSNVLQCCNFLKKNKPPTERSRSLGWEREIRDRPRTGGEDDGFVLRLEEPNNYSVHSQISRHMPPASPPSNQALAI